MKTYTGQTTKEISFPLGGIGTGCIGLAGNGRLKDWEIFNRPAKGSANGYTHFAVKATKNGQMIDARVLQGDLTDTSRMGQYSKGIFNGYGFGPRINTMAGFPHFEDCVFEGEFPLAKLTFRDSHFPGIITMEAFNPFIPLNEKDSSIPGAFFAITLENNTEEELQYQVCFSVANPFKDSLNTKTEKNGVLLEQKAHKESEIGFGQLCVMTDAENTAVQQYWFRGKWQDNIETYWRNLTEYETMPDRSYDTPGNSDTCTLSAKVTIPAGEQKICRFVLTWNIPNNYSYWRSVQVDGKDVSWKNYYAVLFKDAVDSANYSIKEFDRLYQETAVFHDALFSSTLPEAVLDAASANLSTLKGPTIFRLTDGTFYAFEGAHEEEGSCEGTCTHVWNYAYALPFLFPELERTIRDSDFKYNQNSYGKMIFRMLLPLESSETIKNLNCHNNRACVDGQMGGIIKSYREWKLSGDDTWLKKNWKAIKASLEYAWSENNDHKWDLDKDGVMEGRQHHTLDMELFGPSSWMQGFYLTALKAAAEMADYLGEHDSAKEYLALFQKGKEWTDRNLFNGSYYFQKIDLADKSILDPFVESDPDVINLYWNEEAKEIKYQIGEGCAIDQVLAQWHANLCGLGEIFDKGQLRTALQSLYRNNYKSTMRNFYNPWRIFCMEDEAGTVICEYPKDAKKPAIPVPYCQETMHGFEYALAGLMISEGMLEEGLTIIKAVRDRYTGEHRNPWNEIECGSNYARSMASWSFLPIYSGFTFDMVKKEIGFKPLLEGSFRCLWSVDSAWGTIEISNTKATLTILGGELTLNNLSLPFEKGMIIADEKETTFPLTCKQSLTINKK